MELRLTHRGRAPWAGVAALVASALATGPGCGHVRPLVPAPGDVRTVASASPDEYPPSPEVRGRVAPGCPDQPQARPLRHVLVLSAGGRDGAFEAGVLVGWAEAGGRPEFDAVTGVSAGALVAPFAFLGEAFDQQLAAELTDLRSADVYRLRPGAALLGAGSVADPAPLRRRIAAAFDDRLVTRVAAEHARGRRLYVGTTDAASRRFVAWDLGSVAGGPGGPDLFRAVILASCSIPGFFPGVPLPADGRVKTHQDGAVRQSLFLPPGYARRGPADGPAAVYVLVAAKLLPDPPDRPPRRVLGRAADGIATVFRARTRGDVDRAVLTARAAGASAFVAAIPQGLAVDENVLRIEPDELRRLYEVGRVLGRAGDWAVRVPPDGPARSHRR